MKLKKGTAWLQRDFRVQLENVLAKNLVVDLGNMVDFPGRDRLIKNMISCEELEEANYSDIQKQKETDDLRKKQAMVELTRREELAKEEVALRKAMDL